jgi:hypothetical protein
MHPTWLTNVAWLALAAAVISAACVIVDLLSGHRQHMGIMNVVWPVTALWSGPLGLWAYLRFGRAGSQEAMERARRRHEDPPSARQPFPVLVGKGTTHCGSGCALGDVAAEGLFALAPLTLFGHRIFGTWLYAFVAAYLLGIVFQYFTIKPMRSLSVKEGILAAIKADSLSLAAWQVGMFGWMAVARFAIFGRELRRADPVFWLMMQIAMLLGFLTSYPVNWWLLRKGIKEKM